MTDPSAEPAVEPGRSVDQADHDDPSDPSVHADEDARSGEAAEPEHEPEHEPEPEPEHEHEPEHDGSAAWTELSTDDRPAGAPAQGMLPARLRRPTKLERGSMRVLATGGIVGLATVLGAILVGQDVAGWIVGLTIGLTSVILAAILWSSRQL
jgi:hypothetical protein